MSDGARRAEILETAATLFASSGSRTSLKDVATACGILPGSLYHHFDSKEAIVVELVQRYQDDLDRVAKDALDALHAPDPRPLEDRVIAFGGAIASCAVRHRAALLLTVYEPPPGAGDDLARLARQTPERIYEAMAATLRSERGGGAIRAEIDITTLSERLCQSMLHHGVGDSSVVPGAERIPEVRCRLMLEGLAARMPPRADLDRSDALCSVRALVTEWEEPPDDDPRVTRIRDAARAEFGRRGYETTTIRDVAAAADMSIAAIYRGFASKEELLTSVMHCYTSERAAVWDVVLGSTSSPLEKLDAITWAYIQLLDRYSDEYRIQLAWMRESPPSLGMFGSTTAQRRSIKAWLAEGSESGEIAFEHGTGDMRTRCVYGALWTPESIISALGTACAHEFARQTLLEGALSTTSSTTRGTSRRGS
jgi:AcrR family transcriptional regulator